MFHWIDHRCYFASKQRKYSTTKVNELYSFTMNIPSNFGYVTYYFCRPKYRTLRAFRGSYRCMLDTG